MQMQNKTIDRAPSKRFVALLVVAAFLFLMAAAGGTKAVSVYFFNGTLPAAYTNYTSPDRHSLTEVSGRKLNSNGGICINAINDDGTGFAGTSACTYVNNGLASHPYCGCKLRKAYISNDSATYNQEARGQYQY